MSTPAELPAHVRFAEFDLDLRTGELRTNGRKIFVQEQPFQILKLLLERPGQLVTREELVKKLWPSDTFVDFDRSLNKAVNRLRETLEDSADNPRYIETVPRRGYRFIAPVTGTPSPSAKPLSVPEGPARVYSWPVPDEGTSPVDSDPGSPVEPPSAGWTGPTRRRLLVLVCVAILLGAVVLYWTQQRVAAPTILKYSRLTVDGKAKDSVRTDGVRLYFQLATPSGFDLAQTSVSGGEPIPLSLPMASTLLQDISPDGSELLIQSVENGLPNKPVLSLPLPVGQPRRLENVEANGASYAPDGEQIAYTRDSELFLAARDGSAQRKLATVDGIAVEPHWAPDGKHLSFTVAQTTSADTAIWEIDTDGSGLHPLLLGWNPTPAECCGQWTADGKYFLFLSQRDGVQNLWALRKDRSYFGRSVSRPVQLTAGPMEIRSFIPGKDGNKIFVILGKERGELVRLDKKSGQFATYLGGLNAWGLGFSRDAEWVAYTDRADDSLWRSKVDGSQRLRLTGPPLAALKPRWSPDGRQIAFAGSQGKGGHVFLISADGGSPKQLTSGNHAVGFVSWSPDGKTLLLGEWNTGSQEADYHKIHCYFLDVATLQLTPVPRSEGLYGPAWSPDGRYIVAKSQGEDLLLFELQNQRWIPLAKGPAQWATWSHDSRYVYFGSVADRAPALFRVEVGNRKLEMVARLAQLTRQNYGSSPSWLGLAPDDTPLAIRDISMYDIYGLDVRLP